MRPSLLAALPRPIRPRQTLPLYGGPPLPRGPCSYRLAPPPGGYDQTALLVAAVLFLTFGLLAPFGPAAFGALTAGHPAADSIQPPLNSLGPVAVAVGIKGIGSALSNVAIYPDLVLRLPDSPALQATITAWWNAAYAVGWAAGPVLGGALYDAFRLNVVCVGDAALPPPKGHCPGDGPGGGPVDRLSGSVGNSSTCSCDWQPSNGFDGFASATALASLAYALLLVLAAAANIRNRGAGVGAHGVATMAHTTTVEPLSRVAQSESPNGA